MKRRFLGALGLLTSTMVGGAAAPAGATPVEIPAGTRLGVRLDTPLSGKRSCSGDPVTARLIAPLRLPEREPVFVPGRIFGQVVERGRYRRRPTLRLEFTDWQADTGPVIPIHARLTSIDNAREAVDAAGAIVALTPYRLRPGVVDVAMVAVGYVHPVLAVVAESLRLMRSRAERRGLEYAAGTDASVTLEQAVVIDLPPVPPPFAPPPELQALVRALPLRACVASGHPADVTNVALVGSEADLVSAFVAAGWSRADKSGVRADAKVLWAAAERRPYPSAPVSRLEMDGRAPDLVFEKQVDTIARRHHLRLWRAANDWDGRPVWVAAASHDVGLFLSVRGQRVTHHIEKSIDEERAKVVDDLESTGGVTASALVERADAPTACRNAVGDPIETDGRIAVVLLRPRDAALETVAFRR